MSVALNSPETGKKVCLEKIHQPKPKERKLFENYLTSVCKIFILIKNKQFTIIKILQTLVK